MTRKLASLILLLGTLLLWPIPKAQALPDYCPQPVQLAILGDWFPHVYQDDRGYRGADYEFLTRVLRVMGCRLTETKMNSQHLFRIISLGQPLVVVGATATAERRRFARFSDTYRDEVVSLFYYDKPLPDLATVARKKDKIAYNNAAYYGARVDKLEKAQPGKLVHFATTEDRINALQSNKVQAFISDHTVACHYLHQALGKDMSKINHTEVFRVNVSFMFARRMATDEFMARFNQAMAQLMERGVYQNLLKRYVPRSC